MALAHVAPLAAQADQGADDTSPDDDAPPFEIPDVEKTQEPADPSEPPPPPPPAGTNELLGPPLFPFYYHYRQPDQTEVRNVLYPFYYSSSHPSGDFMALFLPLYFWASSEQPQQSTLHIYPLGYLHKRSEKTSYDHLVPLYYDYESTDYQFRGIPPLWLTAHESENDATTHHIVEPLAAYRHEKVGPHAPATTFRFGVWPLLGLTETYTSKQETRVSVLNPLSLVKHASPFSLFHHGREGEHPETEETHSHLFPLFWQWGSYDRNTHFLVPLYGHAKAAGSQDLFLMPLLSRYGQSLDGSVRRDILWPLYHHHYGPKFSSFYSFPLFSYSRTPEVRGWSVLWFLYGHDYFVRPGRTAHSVLYPLGRFEADPDGVRGHNRLLPFYWDNYDEEWRLRLALYPYINYQQRNGTKVAWDFTYLAPTYIGFGPPEDYFGFGFPLYWHSREGSSSWYLFIPLHYSFFTNTSHGFHLFPIFSHNNYPSENLYVFGGPLFVLRRFFDFEQKPVGTGVSLLWPFTTFESRPEGHHYRLFPLFWTSRNRDERDLLIFPWYHQWGGDRSQTYFIPFYGHFKSKRVDRNIYALGTYIYSEGRASDGEIVSHQHDIVWPLLSFSKNDREKTSHQRFLPLGLWNSTGPAVDRTLAGPLYYGHRVEHEDETHRLGLLAGNLWLSKTIHRRELTPVVQATQHGDAEVDTSTARSEPQSKLVSQERGVLWPLLRWGEDESRSSEWLLPFYFHQKTTDDETRAFFPLVFTDSMNDRYRSSLARYLFFLDIESWPGGHRHTVAQLVWDWFSDDAQSRRRWRFLYPFLEFESTTQGYRYAFTPILSGESREEGGERVNGHFLFPLYWFGSTQKKKGDEYVDENQYLYVFPLFGINRKTLRTQYDVLLPFFHIEQGLNSFQFQMRPFVFYRNDPAIKTARLWPFYSYEEGEGAGNWWVSKYLFLAKSAVRAESWSHRIAPFLFRMSSAPESSGFGALLELFAYDREGRESEFRALPLVYGYKRETESGVGVFPFYYSKDSGNRSINYWNPLRFLFLSNSLEGAGFQHRGVLGGLYSRENHVNRPDYGNLSILYGLIQRNTTESTSEFAFFPFYYYSRDDGTLRKNVFLLFPPYWYEETAGQKTHKLFWFIPISG